MPPYSQNRNEINSKSYPPAGHEKIRLKKILLVVVGVLALLGILFIVLSLLPSSEQDKNISAAKAAARKATPNAEVRKVKVADGFAVATVSDPTATGQAKAGSTSIFKVNKDGSMTQIANGSDFSAIDLLGLGIPLTTQAKLSGRNFTQVQKDLAVICGYTGTDLPGYAGFNGTFDPDGWQIDALTLSGLEQALSNTIRTQNAGATPNNTVICVNASRENSKVTTDKTTYISTFTLQAQFITADGTFTIHTLTFSNGHNRSYSLDGRKI